MTSPEEYEARSRSAKFHQCINYKWAVRTYGGNTGLKAYSGDIPEHDCISCKNWYYYYIVKQNNIKGIKKLNKLYEIIFEK